MTDDSLASDEGGEHIDPAPTFSAGEYPETPDAHEGQGEHDGASQDEEGFRDYGSAPDEDEDDASADERRHPFDALEDGYESVDERDVFGEWFDEEEERPYETAMPEHRDEPEWDQEELYDASAVAQRDSFPNSSEDSVPRFPLPTTPPSLAPAAPDVSDRYKDLVTGVLGLQVSANAETVTWTSGQVTVLPYLQHGSTHCTKNLLQKDRDYVADLTRAPVALPSSDLVAFLSGDTEEQDLLQATRTALSTNRTVVIRGCVDTKGFELMEEELWKKYSIFVD